MGGATKPAKAGGKGPGRWSRTGIALRLLRRAKARANGRPVPLSTIRVIRAIATGSSPLNPVSRPAASSAIRSPELGRLLEGVELGTWALGPKSIDALVELIRELRPARILEFGSGSSTVVLAWALRDACGTAPVPRIVSIEQDPEQVARTERLLWAGGLDNEAVVLLAPLAEQVIEGGTTLCYALPDAIADLLPAGLVDLVVVDGPAGPAGVRFGTLPMARPYAKPGATFVLDDSLRDGELGIARRWAALPYAQVDGIRLIEKGLLVGHLTKA